MYKANRSDGLYERNETIFPVGLNVSKGTPDLRILYEGKFHSGLKVMKVTAFSLRALSQ